MELQHDVFEGYPIDYFTFSEEDFNSIEGENNFEFVRKELELSEGYIGNSLYEKLNFNSKNTTVINCAVGQGKTHAVLHSIKEFLGREDSFDTFFVIAVPLKSLITQYKNDLLELGFESDQIFCYEDVSRDIPDSGESYISDRCKIHLVTAITLLGNPGDNAVLQSREKFQYIKTFANELASYSKKLIFVFDEIHETIKKFSEFGIAYLSHFKSVVSKNIILSATYNVQSIAIIKYLSNFTNNKITLLEAERVVIKEQSKLFLHFNDNYRIDSFAPITEVILDLISKDKNLDIICFSKKLCGNLAKSTSEPGISLSNKFGTLQLCTSLNFGGEVNMGSTKSRFDNTKCNIGTNFKSGVNINKENHALVIVMPDLTKLNNRLLGVFSEGPNAIIQAIARQRNAGEIHIILPKPLSMDFDFLPSHWSVTQKEYFKEVYESLSRNNSNGVETKYFPFSQQIEIVKEVWNEMMVRLEMPLALNSNLIIPSFNDFIIEKGELCITKENFFGKDLSAFILYSALTNQFYNAKLENIYFQQILNIEDLDQILEEQYTSLPEVNISEKFEFITSSLNIRSFTNVRSANQKILKFLVDREENISNMLGSRTKDHTKFLRSYFNGFPTEVDDLAVQNIIRFKDLLDVSMICSRSGRRFFRSYENNSLFNSNLEDWKMLIGEFKRITPLNQDFANFFDNYGGLSDQSFLKKCYEFLIELFYDVKKSNTTVNSERGSYLEIIVEY